MMNSTDVLLIVLVWYGDIGLLLVLYGFAAYLLKFKTSILYNFPAYTLYSSLPVALVILTVPNGWIIVLVLASLVSFAAGCVLEEELGINVVHRGPWPGQVSRFIRTARMEFIDAYGTHRKLDFSLGEFKQ